MRPLPLSGKVVVVAGASAGIGLSTAKKCADAGATVIMLARGRDRLARQAALIGDRAVAVPCDVADPSSVRAAFSDIAADFGRIDVLLNVAGIFRVRKIEEASDEDIAQVVGTNLLGPIYTTRAVIPLLRASGGGDIINVSSEMTLDYMPFMVLYGASKAGLEAFSRMMTHELRADSIRVSVMIAGATVGTDIESNFGPGDIERAQEEWAESGYHVRVAGTPMEVEWTADALLFQMTRPRGQIVDLMHVRSAG